MSDEEFYEDEYIDDEYIDDEYIDDDNDPFAVEEITQPDYTIVDEKEKIIEHEKILSSPKVRTNTAISRHDHMMNEKVLDSLRKGKLR